MFKKLLYKTFFIMMAAGVSLAAPKPALLQSPDDWTLKLTFEHPKRVEGRVPGKKEPGFFWYTILTITNNSKDDVPFYPQCELMTDTFQILPEGRAATKQIYQRIKKRHHSGYPFLETLDQAGNRILQGENNTRDVALVWPDFDTRASEIKIFISGLSSEIAVVTHPLTAEKVYLRKTLELSYQLRGDPAIRSSLHTKYKGKRWVMR